jgi:stage V sporulation protein G
VEITEVRIKLMEEPGERLKAFCSITFDDCFVVRDLKIIEGSSGPFVAMPSRKLTSHCPRCSMKNHLRAGYCNQCGSKLEDGRAPKDADGRAKLYADIAHPINSDCREMIQRRVIHDFFEELELAKQPGYVSRYDDFEFEYADASRPRPARFDPPHGQSAPAISRRPAQVHAKPIERPAQQRGNPIDKPLDPPSESGKDSGFGAGIFPEP